MGSVKKLQGEAGEDGVEAVASTREGKGIAADQARLVQQTGSLQSVPGLICHTWRKVQSGTKTTLKVGNDPLQGIPGAKADLKDSFSGLGVKQVQAGSDESLLAGSQQIIPGSKTGVIIRCLGEGSVYR